MLCLLHSLLVYVVTHTSPIWYLVFGGGFFCVCLVACAGRPFADVAWCFWLCCCVVHLWDVVLLNRVAHLWDIVFSDRVVYLWDVAFLHSPFNFRLLYVT
jgi:hypothetical protein